MTTGVFFITVVPRTWLNMGSNAKEMIKKMLKMYLVGKERRRISLLVYI